MSRFFRNPSSSHNPSRLVTGWTARISVWVTVVFLLSGLSALAQDVPELTGRVVDNAGILSPSTETIVTQRLKAHEDSTGNQVAVLTIQSLNGRVLENYSLEVARTWELGQEEFDNGVLLLIAVEDRRMRIEVGFGLEGSLTDATASRIIRNELRPAFRKGDFDRGVQDGVEAILNAIEGTYEPPSASSGGSESNPRVAGIFMMIFGALFSLIPGYLMLQAVIRNGIGCFLIGLVIIGIAPFAGLCLFFGGLGLLIGGGGGWAFTFITLGVPATLLAYFWHVILIARSDKVEEMRKKVEDDEDVTEDLNIGWLTIPAATWVSTQSLSSSSGWSSSSSGGGFSSGGFSSGGGGFSGGGGSFGGGGASGGW